MRFLVITLFLYSSFIFSGEKVVETKTENYIAHGFSENPSKELAKQESCNAAKRELMSFVFGAAFQLRQNMIRSLGVLDYSQDVSVDTGEIILRAAMTETSFMDGVTECSITYPIQEANIEKDRLKSAQKKVIHFVDIGDPNSMRGGVLEIVTIPEDTDVLIDNVRWGTTPLRLNGKLSPGPHTLRLDNPNYKIVEETIEIRFTKTRIDKILKRATGKLKIITDPIGAVIKINEEEVGHSPTNEIELLAGQKLKIEVTHPETETYVQYVTLTRDENKTINQKLLSKPGYISLNVIPNKDVVIGIDRIEKPDLSTNSWIQVEAGTHEISVSANDFGETKFSVDVRGGEKKAIPTIELISLKELEEKKRAEEKVQKEKELQENVSRVTQQQEEKKQRWKLAIHAELNGGTIKGVGSEGAGGMELGYQFSKYVGIETFLLLISGEEKYSDAVLKTNGYQIRCGFPITLSKWEPALPDEKLHKAIALAPEVIYASHSYTVDYLTTSKSVTSPTHKQIGSGGSLIYSIYGASANESNLFFDFRVGAHKYQDVDGLKGASPVSVGISLGGTW